MKVLIQAHPVFQIAEHFFCVYFSFEWAVRFASFKLKRNTVRDAWFVFDSALVLMMVLETWALSAAMLMLGGAGAGGALGNASILRMARLMRLSRMARMVRLFRAMPELLILIRGMVAATRSVFFTLCLLLILLYVFGIAFRQLAESTKVGEEYFSTVLASMYTLLIDATFMDNLGGLVREVGNEVPVCAALMWLFVLLSSLTVMNMLIGVLCEVVSAVAATERETLTVQFVKERMALLFAHADDEQDGRISKAELLDSLENPQVCRLLEEVGVDSVGLIDQADGIFTEDKTQLEFAELVHVILELRGCNTAKVKNIMDLRNKMAQCFRQLSLQITDLSKDIKRIQVATVSDSTAGEEWREGHGDVELAPRRDEGQGPLCPPATRLSQALASGSAAVDCIPPSPAFGRLAARSGFDVAAPASGASLAPPCAVPLAEPGAICRGDDVDRDIAHVLSRLERIAEDARGEIQREIFGGLLAKEHRACSDPERRGHFADDAATSKNASSLATLLPGEIDEGPPPSTILAQEGVPGLPPKTWLGRHSALKRSGDAGCASGLQSERQPPPSGEVPKTALTPSVLLGQGQSRYRAAQVVPVDCSRNLQLDKLEDWKRHLASLLEAFTGVGELWKIRDSAISSAKAPYLHRAGNAIAAAPANMPDDQCGKAFWHAAGSERRRVVG